MISILTQGLSCFLFFFLNLIYMIDLSKEGVVFEVYYNLCLMITSWLLIHANKLEHHLWVCVYKCIQFILKQPPINIKAFRSSTTL